MPATPFSSPPRSRTPFSPITNLPPTASVQDLPVLICVKAGMAELRDQVDPLEDSASCETKLPTTMMRASSSRSNNKSLLYTSPIRDGGLFPPIICQGELKLKPPQVIRIPRQTGPQGFKATISSNFISASAEHAPTIASQTEMAEVCGISLEGPPAASSLLQLSGSGGGIPAMWIRPHELTGEYVLQAGSDGFFYCDPAASALNVPIVRRGVDVFPTDEKTLTDPSYFEKHAVNVFVQVPTTSGVALGKGPQFKRMGCYYLHRTSKKLSKEDWDGLSDIVRALPISLASSLMIS